MPRRPPSGLICAGPSSPFGKIIVSLLRRLDGPPADTMIKRAQGQGRDQGHRVREAGSLGANPDTLILSQLASGPIDLIETRLLLKPPRTPGMRAHDVASSSPSLTA